MASSRSLCVVECCPFTTPSQTSLCHFGFVVQFELDGQLGALGGLLLPKQKGRLLEIGSKFLARELLNVALSGAGLDFLHSIKQGSVSKVFRRPLDDISQIVVIILYHIPTPSHTRRFKAIKRVNPCIGKWHLVKLPSVLHNTSLYFLASLFPCISDPISNSNSETCNVKQPTEIFEAGSCLDRYSRLSPLLS